MISSINFYSGQLTRVKYYKSYKNRFMKYCLLEILNIKMQLQIVLPFINQWRF